MQFKSFLFALAISSALVFAAPVEETSIQLMELELRKASMACPKKYKYCGVCLDMPCRRGSPFTKRIILLVVIPQTGVQRPFMQNSRHQPVSTMLPLPYTYFEQTLTKIYSACVIGKVRYPNYINFSCP